MEKKKKKMVLILIISTVILISGVLGLIIYNKNNKNIKFLFLEVELLSEGDQIDKNENIIILHINSKAKLTYTSYPNKENLDISLNNYDKNILNIDSLGNITALKTGKTELKIYHENIVSNSIIVYVY